VRQRNVYNRKCILYQFILPHIVSIYKCDLFFEKSALQIRNMCYNHIRAVGA
jgi:hypothetical protein